ncbi:MAG: Cys-tRNA(Pro) deacylase [Lachnospiraceae bacterium]|nr:Cys-tRNA(Pro) deacylase [Lachnospiraceae bacterium]
MKKEVKTNVMRILEKEKVPYEARFYPHGKDAVDGVTVAELTGQNLDQVFKTLVTVSNKKEYFVFVIPVAKELDLKKAAKSVGAKSVEMIHVKDINKITGYIRGGCSPVGMKKKYITTYHETAQYQAEIMVSGGKIGTQIACKPDDLIRVTDGQYADICKDES